MRQTHELTYLQSKNGGSLALPHLSVSSLDRVDWAAVRAAGYCGCVFDKARAVAIARLSCTAYFVVQDNTLTLPYEPTVHTSAAAGLSACLSAFSGRVALLSNSAGLRQYDPDGALADALTASLQIPVLRHSTKKPGGSSDAVARLCVL